jgi:hypothetical protein
MGIDLLDLQFRFERVFKIKLDRTESGSIQAASSMNGRHWDIRVRDLVSFIESRIREQNSPHEGDVFEILQRELSACLGVDESKITLDSWMVRDLGMD